MSTLRSDRWCDHLFLTRHCAPEHGKVSHPHSLWGGGNRHEGVVWWPSQAYGPFGRALTELYPLREHSSDCVGQIFVFWALLGEKEMPYDGQRRPAVLSQVYEHLSFRDSSRDYLGVFCA